MTAFAHTTVLLDEAVRLLAPRSGGVYCDGTLGGAGHAEAILEASSPDGRLIGIDRDPLALDAARARLARFGDRATLVHGAFGEVRALLETLGPSGEVGGEPLRVDGFLLDLGISSPQVDEAERGFSFSRPGPLDMRMDTTQAETAGELVQRLDEAQLARVIFEYGEDPYARKIARAMKAAVAAAREAGTPLSTTELAAVIAQALPPKERYSRKTDPATRTFQALRIAVNDELGNVDRFLADFLDLLAPGGRLVVIAFHSLEDRRVKERLRDLARHPGMPADIARAMGVRAEPEMTLLTRKPLVPGDEEVARNPRSRSAKLRAAEKSLV